MDTQLLMKTAAIAGEIMLRCGAETYRVEDTMGHILKTADNIETVDVLVIMTGINATLKVEHENAITVVKRVEGISTDLNKIVQVNEISRDYCGSEITLEEAYEKLNNLKSTSYDRRFYDLAFILIGMGFTLFFGGGLIDFIAAFGVGIVYIASLSIGKDWRLNSFIQDVFSSIMIALASMALKGAIGSSMNVDIVMISAIMPLVPGMAITNGVRDTLRGDYLSGVARILEAFLKAAAIAIGIGLGMSIFGRIF